MENDHAHYSCENGGRRLFAGWSGVPRVVRIQALREQALLSREREETAVRLRFRREADVEIRLKEWVALEQECCPFLVFALETSPGEVVLTISGPESAAALLDDAFGGAAACS
jgi:hypothetical protein